MKCAHIIFFDIIGCFEMSVLEISVIEISRVSCIKVAEKQQCYCTYIITLISTLLAYLCQMVTHIVNFLSNKYAFQQIIHC